tara:strand:+ start:752 stop:1153 length:402 start_codon:yes stop_codon:yes gene_type:complete
MKREKIILSLSILIVILVFFDVLVGQRFSLEGNKADIIIPGLNKKEWKDRPLLKVPISTSDWRKDIFYNRSNIYDNWFKLTGITKFENGYKAIINGEIVNETSRVRGFLVEEITQNQVKLERNDYQVTLNLEE